MGQVSKQQMHAVFGTTKEDEAIVKLLEQGTMQAGSLKPNDKSSRNSSN